jgi:hypothetical protein
MVSLPARGAWEMFRKHYLKNWSPKPNRLQRNCHDERHFPKCVEATEGRSLFSLLRCVFIFVFRSFVVT